MKDKNSEMRPYMIINVKKDLQVLKILSKDSNDINTIHYITSKIIIRN